MRNIMYLLLCTMLCFFACASEDSANTDTKNNGIEQGQTNALNKANNNNSPQQSPNQSKANKTEEKPNTFNAGQANRLGTQYGKRYCKCVGNGGKKKECEESIVKGMESMKKALDPRIYKALERAYKGGKSACR